jgi:tryptophan-rich sensory protein
VPNFKRVDIEGGRPLMNEIASRGQLRLAFARWALFTVPAILFLGFLSGRVSNSGYGNRWFDALQQPPLMPSGWVFGVVWSALYILIAIAFAMVLHARGARYRGRAILLFVVQILLNFAWSPLFFAAHEVLLAFFLILAILGLSILTTVFFGRIRAAAAWLMLPYLLWLSFASVLNWRVHVLNPHAETLVAPAFNAQIQRAP